MEPTSRTGEAVPALRSVLRPQVPSWKRPAASAERRPWVMEDLDPEQLARAAVAELYGAIGKMSNVLKMLEERR